MRLTGDGEKGASGPRPLDPLSPCLFTVEIIVLVCIVLYYDYEEEEAIELDALVMAYFNNVVPG